MTSALTVGQGAAGAVMTATPSAAARWSAGGGATPPAWIVRVLGARMTAQAGLVRWIARKHPDDRSRALRAGAVVDALHGASMVMAAAVWPRYRRSALTSAGMAFLSCAVAAGGSTRPAGATSR